MEPPPSDTVPCPGCAGPMGLDEEVCPHCRRPRDEREIERGKRELMEEAERVRRRPYVLAGRAAAAAAAVVLLLARGHIVRLFSGAAQRVDGEVRRYSDPDFVAGRAPRDGDPERAPVVLPEGPPPPPSGISFSAPARKADTSPLVVPRAPAAPAPKAPAPRAPARRKAKAAPHPPAPDSADWVFYGVVYDMATADSIPGATVTLSRAGQDGGTSAVTDENGFYRLRTPRHPGGYEFVLTATADGYRTGQLEDRPNPWYESPEAKRRAAMAEMTGHDLDPIPRDADEDDLGRENVDILLLPVEP